MMLYKKKHTSNNTGQVRYILLIFILIAGLMISSAIIELQQSKKELYQLMTEQAHSLLESLITASQNTLYATTYLDQISRQRLLNYAELVRKRYEKKRLTAQFLQDLTNHSDIYRIHIFNKKGQRIFSSNNGEHLPETDRQEPLRILKPIFNNEQDTLIIGYKKARFANQYRFVIALAAKDRSAIVLNIDAEAMIKFKRNIDFGALIKKVVEGNSQIVYIALQNLQHILAASGNIRELDSIEDSDFLQEAFSDSLFATCVHTFDNNEIFEAVHPFSFAGETIGLFRIGLSLDPIQDINDRIYRRLIIITIVLIIIGFVLAVYIFTRQRLALLQKQYEVVETYSGSIIENVSDAIVVLDEQNGIKIFNSAAEKLFVTSKDEILEKNLDALFPAAECRKVLDEPSLLKQLNCQIKNRRRELLISKSTFYDSDENNNTILVIRDITEQRQMQAQLERQERLTAMGELASGVAHEIRNPLNTIGTIVQQLDKDFEPASDREEYHELAGLVYNEVKRINDTIQDFLKFARPQPLQPGRFFIKELFIDLQKQYATLLAEKNIRMILDLHWQGEVFWDANQMKQVFINIIQNAIEAIVENGTVSISTSLSDNGFLEIRIQDNGPGMPENIRQNIFNLYFTTKAKGTGIGLSIVQRIVYEHGGLVDVESEPGKGTVFIIRLPQTAGGSRPKER